MQRATGKPRGFAFVEMATPEAAEAAKAALNGLELDGRTINVDNAREQEQRRRRHDDHHAAPVHRSLFPGSINRPSGATADQLPAGFFVSSRIT